MSLNSFSTKVLDLFLLSITDKVFLSIQENRDLMAEYLRAVDKNGLDVTNKYLGKEIKKRFQLNNLPKKRQNKPISILIKSHQQFI